MPDKFLNVVMDAAGLDVWENELVSGRVTRKATKIYAELGYTEQEAGDCMENIFPIIHPDDVGRMKAAINDHITGVASIYQCEFRIKGKSGEWVWYANSGKIVEREGHPNAKFLIGITHNVNSRRQQEEELRQLNKDLAAQQVQLENLNDSLRNMAMTDALTDLPNRRLLIDRVGQALHSARRTKQFGAIMFMDCDNFKAVNDELGHEAGDSLLKQVALRLKNVVRESDTVARISGDEFVVMIENLGTDVTQAEVKTRDVADKILDCLSQPYKLGSEQRTSTVSIGATLMHEGMQSFDDLCHQADSAMYAAKKAGRNRFCMYPPTISS